MFCKELTILNIAKTSNRFRLVEGLLIIINIIKGRIFCQVITINKDCIDISINSISFTYHEWKGHLPSFIKTPVMVIKIEFKKIEEEARIIKDPKIWIL